MGVTQSGSRAIVDRSFHELTPQDLHDIVRLRCDVFVVEQRCAYPELDGRDTEEGTRHVWIRGTDTDPVAAYARLLDDGEGIARVGRVVTAAAERGKGLAAQLVDYLVEGHQGSIVLDAQTYLVEWYESRGFARDGDNFVEDGIPHTPMRRDAEVS